MRSRFTLMGRAVVAVIVILFMWAYLFQNLAVSMVGAGFLLYLTYRRMEFHSLLRQVDVRATRFVVEKVVHKDSPVTIKLEIEADEPITVKGVERIPEHFLLHSGDTFLEGKIRPGRPISLIYAITALERGKFRIPSLSITIVEPRGLFESVITMDPRTELFVRASKKDILLARLMSRRKQFEITGPARSRHARTIVTDFRSVREYMPGDRFRDIDWKASSRLTKLMTKEFEHETNLPTMILMDVSFSMRELVRRRSKIDHAIALALQIAIVMDQQKHPVGMISFDENRIIDHISPGKVDVDEIVQSLFMLPNPVETGGYPGMPILEKNQTDSVENSFISHVVPFLGKRRRKAIATRDGVTGIFSAIREIGSSEETGMLMVLITDLETNSSSMVKALKRAVLEKHRVVLVSPFSWAYHLEREDLSADVLEKVYRDYQKKRAIMAGLKASGVRVIEVSSRERGDRVLSGLRRMSR